MRPRNFGRLFALLLFFALPSVASANHSEEIFPFKSWTVPAALSIEGATAESRSQRIWHVTFDQQAALRLDAVATAKQRPQAFQYSESYNTRRKIHMIASYATLPLFVGQWLAGEKL